MIDIIKSINIKEMKEIIEEINLNNKSIVVIESE